MTFLDAVLYATIGAAVGAVVVGCAPILLLVAIGLCIPALMSATSTVEPGVGSFTDPCVSSLQSSSSKPCAVIGGVWCFFVLLAAAFGAVVGLIIYF